MTTSRTPEIGEQIRRRREALDLSREGLAYKAEISHKTLERIEAGRVTPRRATANAIERALLAEEEGVVAA